MDEKALEVYDWASDPSREVARDLDPAPGWRLGTAPSPGVLPRVAARREGPCVPECRSLPSPPRRGNPGGRPRSREAAAGPAPAVRAAIL